MRMTQTILLLSLILAASQATAGDLPFQDAQLTLSRSASGRETLVFQGTDPAIVPPTVGGADDPTLAGATIEVFSIGDDTVGTLQVPATASAAPAQWKISRAKDFTFTNRDAPAGPSAVRSLVVQRGKKLRVVARDVPLALAGTNGGISVRVTMGTARWCARLDGASVKRDQADVFRAKGAAAPVLADCSNFSLGMAPVLPAPTQTCPTLASGTNYILGRSLELWIGPNTGTPRGPIVFVWHQAGGTPQFMVALLLGSAQVQQILDAGGIVAAFYGDGSYLGFSASFLPAVDELVGCADQQFGIDPRRVYTMGFSAGALQATTMASGRSGYVASVVSYSGGFTTTEQDPTNRYPALVAHGGTSDVFILPFDQLALDYNDALTAAGHFTLLCNHGGGHTYPPELIAGPGLQFLLDHPFGTRVSPYAGGGLPPSVPGYCVPSS